jgi:hypothetical protein
VTGRIFQALPTQTNTQTDIVALINIYYKSGVLALETKAPIGKQYLVCIDFHDRNNSQN